MMFKYLPEKRNQLLITLNHLTRKNPLNVISVANVALVFEAIVIFVINVELK